MPTKKPAAKKVAFTALTELASSAYGANHRLILRWPAATTNTERFNGYRALAAATFRAAAMVTEGLEAIGSRAAVGVDEHAGVIHLEFSERDTKADEDAARKVLDAVAKQIG